MRRELRNETTQDLAGCSLPRAAALLPPTDPHNAIRPHWQLLPQQLQEPSANGGRIITVVPALLATLDQLYALVNEPFSVSLD